MRTRELVAALAVVLVADVAVVATRSGGDRAPAAAPVVNAAGGAPARPAAAPPKATPKPKPKPKAKPKPPPRLLVSTTTDSAAPRVMSVALTGGGTKAEKLPAVQAHAVSRANGLAVASETLDYNEYTGCGIAGCTTTRATEAGIVLRNLSGGQRKVLTKGGYDSDPSFSPDGSSIAYLSHARRADGSETDVVELIATTGESLRTYVAPNGRYAAPVWSPDGQHIAVVEWPARAGATPAVVLLPVGAGSPRTIGRGRFDQLRWAPNGRFLVARGAVEGPHVGYGTTATTGYDLWVVAVSGVPARRLTRLAPPSRRSDQGAFCGSYAYEYGAIDPVVSPDSRTVAYSTNAPHRSRAARAWDVEVVNVDGTGRRTVWRAPAAKCAGTVIRATVGRALAWM